LAPSLCTTSCAATLVHHFLRGDSVYGVFATLLGLLAWIYLAVEITVCAAETNVVLARRLWPRTIVQPPLTDADRAVLAAQALQNQRRHDQQVHVSFGNPPEVTTSSPRPPLRGDSTPPLPARPADAKPAADLATPGRTGG
jgi:hypothetical protein